MIKGFLCHLRIIVFVVVYALGAYAPFDQHFADAQGVSPVSGGSPAQNVCPQCPASGTGDASCCCCLEQHIRNYDGDNAPNWFPDADPLDGAREPRDYEIKELTGSDLENAEIDPNESALTGVVDAWDMTPQEIFEAEYAKLKPGEQWLVDRVIEGNGRAPSRIPKEAIKGSTTLPVFKDLTTTHKLSLVDVFLYNPNPPQSIPDGPAPVMTAWYELRLGQQSCYYRCAKNRELGAIASPGEWLCKENLQLFMCINPHYLHKLSPAERLQEILSTKSNPNAAIDAGLFVLDFAVGMTPFLGTFDQVAQDWDELKALDPAAVGICLAGFAGDVAIVGKLSQLIKGANAASKFGKAVTVTSFAAGAGSVAAGATGLYLQNREDWKEGSTWGRAAFIGIQAIGLITDRDAHRIIAPHIKRIALKAKMPQAWAACKSGCGRLKEKVKLFAKDEYGEISEPRSVTNLLCKACPGVGPGGHTPPAAVHTTRLFEAPGEWPYVRPPISGSRIGPIGAEMDVLKKCDSVPLERYAAPDTKIPMVNRGTYLWVLDEAGDLTITRNFRRPGAAKGDRFVKHRDMVSKDASPPPDFDPNTYKPDEHVNKARYGGVIKIEPDTTCDGYKIVLNNESSYVFARQASGEIIDHEKILEDVRLFLDSVFCSSGKPIKWAKKNVAGGRSNN